MSTADCGISEEIVPCGSAPASAPGSPKEKVKFLCSHAGKILPRPSDGHLKYVGGETRVISVPRDIKFHELMKKLTYQLEGDMVLKYQLVPEDLDALVSVKTDEDLRYMMDECDRCGSAGLPRLRAFLFPAKPVVLEPLSLSGEAIEQRYIDAINGIIRAANAGTTKPLAAVQARQSQRPVFSISSGCSSPKSPDEDGVSFQYEYHGMQNGGGSRMHKVQSMPSFGSLMNVQQQSSHYNNPPMNEFPQSHNYQNYLLQNQRHGGYQSSRLTMDPSRGFTRMGSVRSIGGSQLSGSQLNNHYHPRPSRTMVGGCFTKSMMGGSQFDDFGHYGFDRSEKSVRSASMSPVPLSPRYCPPMAAATGDF